MSIARFAVNKPVPVNLLMIAILLAGIFSGLQLRREFFPETDPDQVQLSLEYPGATPSEVEEGLAIKIEDKLADLDEVEELRSVLSEGGGGITVEIREGVDPDEAMDEIERTVDTLTDLPDESEEIRISLFEPKIPVIRVMVYGDLDEPVMKTAIRQVREDLRTLPGMGETVISGVRDHEVRVDIEGQALLEHGISLPQVADAIRAWMVDTPGGTVRSPTGNVKVRTMGVAERARAVRQIVVRADPQGHAIHVGDIARVAESFVDEEILYRFNGQPAAGLTVFKVGNQDIVHIAEMVRAYVQGRNGIEFERHRIMERVRPSDRQLAWELGTHSTRPLPRGAKIAGSSDFARFVEGRMDLLVRNAKYGAVLVFMTLLAFLNWRVAFWVGVGLVTALMGTLVLMTWTGVTLNLLTMFGLIVVLGLLVDDAIVVSENIQSLHDRGQPALQAAVAGTEQVLWPVVATVLTSVVAFLPLTFIRGQIGDLLGALPQVVACALMMSLVESVLILPSHMGHSLAKHDRAKPGRFVRYVQRVERWRDHVVLDRVVPLYGRVLSFLLRERYVTVTIAIATLIVTVGMVRGGRIGYVFLPSNDAESVIVDVRMPIGTPVEKTNEIVTRIEAAAVAQAEIRSVSSVVGQRSDIDTGAEEAFTPHVAQIFLELHPVEERDRESSRVVESIREKLHGSLEEVERIAFTEMTGGAAGPDISIQVRGDEVEQIAMVVTELKETLAGFSGVHDIADDHDLGQAEVQISLRPGAAALGFTTAQVAQQVRGFLFGIDAHVFADRQEDIDVRVRLEESGRRNLTAVENCWLISPQGQAVPLREIADLRQRATYATIKRIDRQRAVTVSAYTAPGVSPESITGSLDLEDLRQRYPGLHIEYSGRQKQQIDAFESLPAGFMAAMVMIYVILAWLFSSYTQPLVVLIVVPFSTIGVVWGHLLLGFDMTFLSLIGFVALTGIVVNDSLILVKFYNEQRDRGQDIFDSLVAAGRARLRAILLTTITTVLGLTPLLLEQSFQARFLIPMAISIACGLISATVLVLVVLPSLILISDDVRGVAYFLWHGNRRQDAS